MAFTRIALRNISRRKLRNTLTLVAIILGVMLLVGVNVAADSAIGEFHKYINKAYGETDIVVKHGNAQPFDQENVTLVGSIEGVSDYTPRLSWEAAINNDSRKLVGIVGIQKTTDFLYSSYNITGSADLSGNNVVASEALCEKYDLTVGNLINVTTVAFPGLSSWNRTYVFKIIGVYHPLPQIGGGDYVIMDLQQVQNISALQNKIDHIIAKVSDTQKTVEIADELQKTLGSNFDVSAPKENAIQQIQGMLQGFLLGINVVITVSLTVCTFLVFNTMFMSVSERSHEIGVLRALGTSRRQIFWMLFNEGLILGLIGTPLGILIGFGLSRAFLLIMRTFSQPALDITSFILTPTTIWSAIAAGLITVILGTFYPAIRTCRISVVQALRPSMRTQRKAAHDIILLVAGIIVFAFGVIQQLALIPFRIGFIDMISLFIGAILMAAVLLRKIVPLIDSFLSHVSLSLGKLVSRNVGRKLLRSTVCFSIIGISLSFIVLMGGIQSGVVIAMEQGIRDVFGADIILVANQTVPTSFANELENLTEIETATPVSVVWQGAKCFAAKNMTVGVAVIDPETFPKIANYEFISPTPETVYEELSSNTESLILPKSLADDLGVEVGQNISVLTMKPNTRINFTVAGVFTSPVLQFISFGGFTPLSQSIGISFNTQRAHFYGEDKVWVFMVNVKPEYRQQTGQVLQKIEATYPEHGFDTQPSTATLEDLLSNVRSQINNSLSIFFIILYFTVFITGLGIAVTMIMNVAERKREIGILRSQGMSRSQVLIMFLTEALIIGLVGFIIGLPCGVLILKGITSSMSIMGLWFPFMAPWAIIIQALLLAVTVAIVGAVYPAYKASKMDIVEALRVA
ncbi:MAG: FtsX-like permease family protein [Candidatus Bathyarchaeota archaeon]|nr:FtsX-like permease family protein [Candidatus Bathyarchaeota archaeon]